MTPAGVAVAKNTRSAILTPTKTAKSGILFMHNRFTQALALSVFLSCSALAADHVLLSNGDTLTGAIVKKDGDTLTIKSELLGVVSMPWKAVKSITSDAELNVVLPSGETVKGKLSRSKERRVGKERRSRFSP